MANDKRSQTARPRFSERPILCAAEDLLDRSPFVERVTDALVDPRRRRSTGIVLGITGPWGSGKSSILNLLERDICSKYQNALILRFDPWLVSGRDDLVALFVRDLLAAIESKSHSGDEWHKLSGELIKYAKAVRPFSRILPWGIGDLINAIPEAINPFHDPSQTLSSLRGQLSERLNSIGAPIVVIIDELDRVEDNEVRTVAQLIRSILDFPRISFVVGYDHDRVVQALGSSARGGPKDRTLRGRAYLEKIVQLAIPLPITLGGEIEALLDVELAPLAQSDMIPKDFSSDERFADLKALILTDGIVSTPRDIKRLIGGYQVLLSMTVGEVDWVDLLGYCALSNKAPRLIERLRSEPDLVVDDPTEMVAVMRAGGIPQPDTQVLLGTEYNEDLSNLVGKLFPAVGTRGRRRSDEYLNPISSRRSLLITQRLGLIPGTISRRDIDSVVGNTSTAILDELTMLFEGGEIQDFVERFNELYPDGVSQSYRHEFWLAASAFFSPQAGETPVEFLQKRRISDELSRALYRKVDIDKDARDSSCTIFAHLNQKRDLVFVPNWLRRHFFMFGILGARNDGNQNAFLTVEETEQEARSLTQFWRTLQLEGDLILNLRDFHAVYAMQNTDAWDSECYDALTRQISSDDVLDRVVLISYGSNYFTDFSTIRILCDGDVFISRLRDRRNNLSDDSDIRPLVLAYDKCINRSPEIY